MNGNIDQLKKLYEEHRGSEWIAINYSWGLGKLAEKQELPESTETVQFLKQLHELFPNNERDCRKLFLGLGQIS